MLPLLHTILEKISEHPKKVLAAVLSLHVLLYFLFTPVIRLVDDYNYIYSAYDLLEQGAFSVKNTFAGRWIIFPLVLSMKVFGVSNYTVTLPAFIANIWCIVLVYVAIPKKTIAIAASFLAACSYFILFHSLHFMPDVFVNVCSLAFLVALQRYHKRGKLKWLLIGSAFLCLGVLMKLSTLYLVLLFIVWLLATRKSIGHILASFSVSACVALVGMWYYHHFFDDALFRIHVIESEHNFSVYSYHDVDIPVLLQRIFLGPLKLLVEFSAWGLIVCLSLVIVIRHFKTVRKDFWLFFAVGFFLLNWFGSTSLAYYTPLPIYHRMWAGSFLFLLIFIGNRAQLVRVADLCWAVTPLLAYSLVFNSGSRTILLASLLLLFFAAHFLKAKVRVVAPVILLLGFVNTWRYFPQPEYRLYEQFEVLHTLNLDPELKVYARHPTWRQEALFAKIEQLESLDLVKYSKHDTFNGYLFHQKRITDPIYLKQIDEVRKTATLVFENEHIEVFKSKP